FVLFLICLFSFGLLNAQKCLIKGTVTDYNTGETLIGVNILYGEGKGTVTDINGNYSVVLPNGEYKFTVSYVGYNQDSKTVNLKGKTIHVDFRLKTVTLSEVEVVADMATTRETPVAFTNITPLQLEEELAARDIPMVLNRTPGVYATQQGGGDGDARINIRGFSQRNVAVMLDGIPVNDMENGWVYWSNWFGLDIVTRNIQLQRGLGVSKLAIPSVGGTMNIISKGIEANPGIVKKQEVGSDGYIRTSLGITTGRMKNGFGITLAGAYKSGDGWVDEGWSKGWFYFLRIDKKLGNHILSFSAMGAPQEHGQRRFSKLISIYDTDYAKDLGIDTDTLAKSGVPLNKGLRYNLYWGYLEKYTVDANGDTTHADRKKVNTRKNFYHKPLFNLRDFWNVNDKLYISNIVYLSIGNGGGTGLTSTPNPTPNGQVDLQNIYDANYSKRNDPTQAGKGDALYAQMNNHFWYGLLTTFTYKLNKLYTMSGGIDLRNYVGEHYEEVYDLLGADFYTDEIDQTTLQDPTNPSTRRELGDKIYYHNEGYVKWGGIFYQTEYKTEKITAFINISGAYSGYQRVDYFKRKDLVLDDTIIHQAVGYIRDFDYPNWVSIDTGFTYKGKTYYVNSPEARTSQTDWEWFGGYTVKGGLNYLFTKKSNVFVNLGYISKAPRFNNVFDRNNHLYYDIKNEIIKAFELGYGYFNSKLTLNINGYYTKWENKPSDIYVSVPVSSDSDEKATANINGIDALHMGIEIEMGYKITDNLLSETVMAFADWRWKSGDSVRLYSEIDNTLVRTYYFNAKDIHVGDAAQIQLRESLRWEIIRDLYLKGSITYFGKHYSYFDPLSLSPDYPDLPKDYEYLNDNGNPKDSWKVPDYFLVDLHAGYGIKYDKLQIYFTLSVINALNEIYISDARNNDTYNEVQHYNFDAASASVFFGMGRRYLASMKIVF
ncbi:TonB-dependent receptor, partial [candidate division KSB1 bacterium]